MQENRTVNKITQITKRGLKKGFRISNKLFKSVRGGNSSSSTTENTSMKNTVTTSNITHLAMGWTTPQREQIVELALQYAGASHIYGNYVEFGVWRGDTFASAFHFSEYMNKQFPKFKEMNFYALDSFEGFPELKGDDNFPQFKEGGRAYSLEAFNENMKEKGVDMNRVKSAKGWFSDTLVKGGKVDNDIKEDSISLAYIDCDLYESTADVMKFIGPKMMSGGLMMFDDWYCFAGDPAKGQQRAIREFLKANPTYALAPFREFHWHGNSFIFHKYDDEKTVEELRKNNLVL